MTYDIHIGMDLQTVEFGGPPGQLVNQLEENDWCYFKSWEGTVIVVHSYQGKYITSINQIIENKTNGEAEI